MLVPPKKKRRGRHHKKIEFGTYQKPCKDGQWMRRRVVAVYPGYVKYLQDTEERPNVLFKAHRKTFLAWMRKATLEVVN